MKAHIIGVSGVAMSATAKLLLDAGWEVSGSDDSFYPPASTYAQKLGIPFFHGYKPENIPTDVDLVIIGRNAKLAPDSNPEVKEALARKLTIKSYPEVLAELFADKHRVVVAGSFGKSTVTSLIAWVLLHAGKDPGYFIGAYPIDMEYTSSHGSGDIAVLEGDEYLTSHFDDRSKFLHYSPKDIVLTAVEHDHFNVFPSFDSYKEPFKKLIQGLPEDGLLVASYDDPSTHPFWTMAPKVVTYGLADGADWYAKEIVYGETTTFILTNGDTQIQLQTKLLGAHNVQNIVGAAAFLLTRDLVTEDELVEAIRVFSGVKRRLNKITKQSKIPAYEGFGSSYEKAESAIKAMRLHFPNKKLVVLFEPHAFSWRNRDALSWYDTIFEGIKSVIVSDPDLQGASTHTQLTRAEILKRINDAGVRAVGAETKEEIHDALKAVLEEDSVLLILSSGNLHGALDTLPSWLDQTFS